MLDIFCIYERTLFRDEKTGYTRFLVKTDDPSAEPVRQKNGGVVCCGIIACFPIGLPLHITGEEKEERPDYPCIKVSSCTPQTGTRAAGTAFLSGGQFFGIGMRKAQVVMDIAGDDLFAFCARPEAVGKLSEAKGITADEAEEIVQKTNRSTLLQKLLVWLVPYGGSYADAEKIYDEYGEASIERIKENPYHGGLYCLDYTTREAVGREKGIKTHDKRRVRALIREAFRITEEGGSTCLDMKHLFAVCRRIEKHANMGYKTDQLCIAAAIAEERQNYTISYQDDKVLLYRRLMYDEEEKTVHHIRRLMRAKKKRGNGSVEKTEKTLGISYDPEQKKAVELAGESGIVVVTGGPGTGKSTVIRGMIDYFRQCFPEGEIALCAPTGNAAKRIRELTGEDAQTIHRLLEVRPFETGMLACRDEYNQLSYDMIVVDEFSMADMELFMMLLSGIKNGALLVLSGDEEQLPSVGPGNVFHDMIGSGLFPTCRLTKVHRQKGGSSILENAARIREGNPSLISDENTKIICVDTEKEVEDTVVKIMERYYDGKRHMRLYTPVKSPLYPVGKTNMNLKIREKVMKKDNSPKLVYDGIPFSKGDPVIMTRNNYDTGYLNGDEGVVWKVHELADGKKFLEVLMDGELKVIAGSDLADIDLAYALTTHKAQGSECDISVIVVPERPAGMLFRSLVYVAATRARSKNIFIIQPGALEKAVATDSRPWRQTGLGKMLTKDLPAKTGH